MNVLKTTAFAASVSAITGLGIPAFGQTVILSEDFEGDASQYTTSFDDTTGDAFDFFRVADAMSTFQELTGVTGNFFAASDIDGIDGIASTTTTPGQGAERQTLTFSGLDVSSFASITLSLSAAEDDDLDADGNLIANDWDLSDLVEASFVFDGAPATSAETGFALLFSNDGSTFNSAPFLNQDFDATGADPLSDPEVTSAFSSFSSVVSTNGALLADLVLTFDLNSGDEDFAIDNIVVTGIIPEPASAALLAIGSTLLLGRRRRTA